MKFKILLFLFFYILSFHAKAQYYYYNDEYYDNPLTFEAGISFGPMNSLTDIGGRKGNGSGGAKDLNIKSTTLSGGIYLSGLYEHFLGLRVEGTFGKVQSNDSLLAGVKSTAIGRYNRNLSFRSPISEFSVLAEFYPVQFFKNFNPDSRPTSFAPYIVGGVGVFHFNPQANLNGQWIDLQPLHTEGEGFVEYPESKQYNLTQMNFSFGIGLAYELSPKFDLKIEYISRVLRTDYLDDVHGRYIDPGVFSKYLSGTQLADALILNDRGRSDAKPNDNTNHPGGIRGNPNNDDSYFSINIKVGYIFGRKRISGGGSRSFRNQYKSPRLF
ncbi:MAG TPA: hypothetical protein VIJ75_21950 [Hanamia sp.]